jgi:hypothetical protein
MLLIEEGSFLSKISPSFSYGLGAKNPVKMVLNYSDIDIQGIFIFRQGVHEITVESNKTASGKKIIIINETLGV